MSSGQFPPDGPPPVPPPAPPPRTAPPVRRFDAAAERLTAGLRGRRGIDRLAYLLSEAGTHSAIWHAINLADAVLGPVLTGDPIRRRLALRRSVIQVVEQVTVNGPAKLLFGRERPSHITEHPHDLRAPRTSSFPSGHASAGACAATLLHRDLGHPLCWYALAGAVGWSRVHVGVHHPSDVVGGAVIGWGLASLAARRWPPPHRSTRTR